MGRIGQVSVIVNGDCVPAGRSRMQPGAIAFTQKTFELAGGPGAGNPNVEVCESVADIYTRAHGYLMEMEEALAEKA